MRLYIEEKNPMKEIIVHRKKEINIHVIYKREKESESFKDQLISRANDF